MGGDFDAGSMSFRRAYARVLRCNRGLWSMVMTRQGKNRVHVRVAAFQG